jgi:hypothetical protein
MDAAKARALADVWSQIQSRVVERTIDIGRAEVGQTMHIDSRPDAIYEGARLLLFVGRSIVDFKEGAQPFEAYDPQAELAHLESDAGRAVIEGTARNVADGAWKPLLKRFLKRHPIIATPPPKNPPRRVRKTKEPHRSRMHFVPQFSSRPWVDAVSGKFDVHQIGVDGEVRTTLGTAKLWGAVDYIYTQRLEARFGQIESQARQPYEKLCHNIPFNRMDTEFWVAFLITQILRTPRAMAKIMAGTRSFIEASGTVYPTDPAHLARAFETMFEENEVFAGFHRLVTGRRWSIARCAAETSFLKGDHPVALSGSTAAGKWTLVYPLTPSDCFVAGPEGAAARPDLLPAMAELTALQSSTYNALICREAEASVIAKKGANDPAHLRIIKANLFSKRPVARDLPLWGLSVEGTGPRLAGSRKRR